MSLFDRATDHKLSNGRICLRKKEQPLRKYSSILASRWSKTDVSLLYNAVENKRNELKKLKIQDN
jgi:hypothetical protein